MIIKPLSKHSKIPNEEKSTAEILNSLPNNWLCICGNKDTYFSFLKNNKKLRGTQIDFVVINEYGIFFLESKNVSIIKSEYNNLVFVTNQNEEYNPLYRAIEYPNLAKNWFLEKLRKSKKYHHLYKKSDLKFSILGTVVITNDNYRIISPQKELKLQDIMHYKQYNVTHRSELKNKFFKNFFNTKKAPHHEKLNLEDVLLLFNILLHQNLDVDDVLTPESERNYEMLKYLNKYKINTQSNQNELSEVIRILKEEKEELEGQSTLLIQKNKELIDEKNIELGRLHDQQLVINNLEKKANTLTTTDEELNKELEKQNFISNTYFNVITNSFNALIKNKVNFKNDKSTLIKKINAIKKIKILNLVLIPFAMLSIIAIIILTFFLLSEMSKSPPTPADIFFESYEEIEKVFNNKKYDEVISSYNLLPYSFTFLTNPKITLYSYYLGFSYFANGDVNSSQKETGIKMLSNLDFAHLSIKEILNIYPDVFYYLKQEFRYEEAGNIISKFEKIIDNRNNELEKDKKNIYDFIEAKLFLINVITSIDESDINEVIILSYLSLGASGSKRYTLDGYIEDLFSIIEEQSFDLKSKIDKTTGLYPPAKNVEILDSYQKLLEYIEKIKSIDNDGYQSKINRFTNLKINIYKEIGRLKIARKLYKESIESFKTAEENYLKLKSIYENINDFFNYSYANLPNYLEMFMLFGQSYDGLSQVCEAYKVYWKAYVISLNLPVRYKSFTIKAKAKVDYFEEFIKKNLNDGFNSCDFSLKDLKKEYPTPINTNG